MTRNCKSKLGDLCWLATASRPDICARLTRSSANLNNLQVVDVYRIHDLIKTVKLWQKRCTLKYPAGLAKPVKCAPLPLDYVWGRSRPIHEGTMMLVGWSEAAFGPRGQDGRRRLGNIIGLMSSTLTGSVHLLPWTSKFNRKRVKSSQGGDIFALCEM